MSLRDRKRLISVVKKSVSDSLSNFIDLRECVLASHKCKTELLANFLAALDKKARATEKFRQTRATISTQTRTMIHAVLLKKSFKDSKDNFAFYKASKEGF